MSNEATDVHPDYDVAQIGTQGGEIPSAAHRRYLRVFTAPGETTPRAGLHAEPKLIPTDGWASGTALTTPADAAMALEKSKGDTTAVEQALLAIAITRESFGNRNEAILAPKGLKVWKAYMMEAVSHTFDYVFGSDEDAAAQAAADAARRGAESNLELAGSLPMTDPEAIYKIHSIDEA